MKIVPLAIFAFVTILAQNTEAARILGLFPFPGKSHWFIFKTILTELVSRGHHVTVITNFPLPHKMENYTEIVLDVYDFWALSPVPSLYDLETQAPPVYAHMVWTFGLATTEHALKSPNVQKLIESTDQKFDLIFSEVFYQEAMLMFAYKYGCPVVTIGTLGLTQFMSGTMGSISPWAQVPYEYSLYNDKMTFWERFLNVYASLYDHIGREIYYLPKNDEMAKTYFKSLPGPLPSVRELERNVSMILLNSHVSLGTPRPFVPGIIEIGGVHVRPPNPLPADIKKFLDSSVDGVVYFSMGTNLRSADFPSDKVQAFLSAFGKLKQTVLWKWEDEKLPNIPSNVKVLKWMPQSDILAHPNIKVFISHGGLLGSQEAVHRGVPVLGIPIYCDQELNIRRAVNYGYAVTLKFKNISESSLDWAFDELINNPKYMASAKAYSARFRDRPEDPLDTAIFWIEYVLRHKGATHLRSSALDLAWYSYYLIDVAVFVLSILGFILFSIHKLVKYCTNDNKNLKVNLKKNK